jgi:hypothetical protein
MLCSFGPWGVIDLPRSDQVRHLEKLMADNGLFRDGRFVPAPPEQIPTEQQQILDILRYLKESGGLEVLRDRLPPGPKSADILADNWRLAEFLGLYRDYAHPGPPPPQPRPVACPRYEFSGSNYFSSGSIVDVKGYSFLLNRIEIGGCGAGTGFIESGSFRGPRKTDKIMFRCRDNTAIITLKGQTLSIPLEKVMIGLEESPSGKDNCGNSTPIDSALLVQGSNGQIKVALQILKFGWTKGASRPLQSGLKKGSSPRLLESLEFDLLLEYKETGRPVRRSP